MHLPHWRINDLYPFNKHIFAAVRLNKIRSQLVGGAEYTLFDRRANLHHLIELFLCRPLIVMPIPPMILVGLSVKRALTGNGDIWLVICIDERLYVHGLHS